jgi:hypothetical protein
VPQNKNRRVIDNLISKYPPVGRWNPQAPEPGLLIRTQSAPWTATDFARTIPYWFLAVVGLVYASGFLIEMIHLGTYGIRDVGGELWKARDIHIGVLGLVFPVTIAGTTLYTVLAPLFRAARPLLLGDWRWELWSADVRRLTNGFIVLPLELAFYSTAMLHRDSASAEPYGALALMLAIALVIPRLCSGLEGGVRWLPKALRPPRPGFVVILRVCVAAYVTNLARDASRGYWSLIKTMLCLNPARVLLYTLLLFGICGWLYSVYQRYRVTREVRFLLLAAPLVALMYYLALVGFAHCFFPLIPASRGGGDYRLAPTVSIQPKTEISSASPALSAFLRNGDPKVLIDETSTTLFVADECTEGGPPAWMLNHPRARPTVWALGRDDVAVIRYTVAVPDADMRARCPRGLWSPSEYPPALFWAGSSSVASASAGSARAAKARGKER